MRKKKVKQLKKEYLELENNNVNYDIKGRVVEGITFRQFKKNADKK
jgi:hypothetical protein